MTGARPLDGRRVLVTRSPGQSADLVQRLIAAGAEPITVPLIRIAPPEDPGPLLRAAAAWTSFDWIVFTSANAADAFMAAGPGGLREREGAGPPRICAVGTATARRLAHHGVRADLVPDEFRADAAAEALVAQGGIEGQHVLLPRSAIGREVLAERLRRAGAVVTAVVAYRTMPAEAQPGEPDVPHLLREGAIDAVTFTSASTVRHFAERYGADAAGLLQRTVVAVIGPVTADAARQLGIPVHVQPATHTVPALVDALAAHMMGGSGRSA